MHRRARGRESARLPLCSLLLRAQAPLSSGKCREEAGIMEAAQVGPITITLRRKIFGKTGFFPVLEAWLRNRAAGARKAGRQAAIFGLKETNPDSPNRCIPHSFAAAAPRPDRWLTAHRGLGSRRLP